MQVFREASAMDWNRILLAAETPQEIPRTPQVVYALILVAGTAILLTWIIWFINHGAHDPLRRAPVRRHRLPVWFAPTQIFIWLAVAAAIALVSGGLEKSETYRQVISYMLLGIWDTLLIALFLVVSYFGFVRGFKGLGLRIRTIPMDLLCSFLVFLAALPLIEIALRITTFIGYFIGFELEKHPSLMSLEQYPQWWMQALIVVFAVIIAPVIEELLFRGLFQSTITGVIQKPWVSILITSGVFAILHPPTHWFALFVLSIALGFSYEKSGSLFRPLFIHILFNGFSVALTLWALPSGG